jgi:hypothetical protein
MIRLANSTGAFKGFPSATMPPMTFLGRRYLGAVGLGAAFQSFTHTHNLNVRVAFIQGMVRGDAGTNGSDTGHTFVYNPPVGAWADIMFSPIDRNSFSWGFEGLGNGGTWFFYADMYGDNGTNTWGGSNYTPS